MWLLLDKPDYQRDLELAQHVCYVHRHHEVRERRKGERRKEGKKGEQEAQHDLEHVRYVHRHHEVRERRKKEGKKERKGSSRLNMT